MKPSKQWDQYLRKVKRKPNTYRLRGSRQTINLKAALDYRKGR